MFSLADLPIEVLLDNVLPSMSISDVLNLGSTNKFFATLTSDNTFWQRRLKTDFNFSGQGSARTSGWKFIYSGLFNPKVYVWGEQSNGRLGLPKFPKVSSDGVPFPMRLQIPGVRIVSLIASGMSFHALDSEGQIYVWGTLDGTLPALRSDGFSVAGKCANTPLRLQMPAATRSISCGRLHASTLDSSYQIWTFPSWGRPFKLVTHHLADSQSKPLQVDCGWSFSAVLTVSGEILVWWPFSGEMGEQIRAKYEAMDEGGNASASARPDNVIPCATWDLHADPVLLPSIPPLPDLFEQDNDGLPVRLVQIAGLDNTIIGLTNRGHVLKFDSLDSKESVPGGRWEYLPSFSELGRIQAQFSRIRIVQPKTVKITHISANFKNFIAYSTGSSSIVLIGNTDTRSDSEPKVIPELQSKFIISVVLGDYHNVALTSTGKVFTWGQYSAGALGLGDPTTLDPGTPGGFETEAQRLRALDRPIVTPPNVEVPTEVRFDHGRKTPKERFCFSIAAAGWHTGALVIDLEPDKEKGEETEVELEEEEVPLPRRMYEQHVPGQGPPIIPFPGFRIGLAGRGRGRGWGWGG